jgi:hypothetical protein
MAPSRIAVRARRRSLVKDLGFPDPRGARSLRRRSHGTRGAVCCGALGPLMARLGLLAMSACRAAIGS